MAELMGYRGEEGNGGGAEQQGAHRNRLLRALPVHEYACLAPYLENMAVTTLQVLLEADDRVRHMYFPETTVLSMLHRMRDGTAIETGAIGCDGAAGFSTLLGVHWSPTTMVGQVPGTCWRVSIDLLEDWLPRLPVLNELLRRYALAFMDQLAQTIACNSLHSVEQRCMRWLLMAHDRVGQDEFHLTHEVLAQLLAVRRAGVTTAALGLQRAGLISYSRGHVTILDRAGLEAAACECHAVMWARAEQVFGNLPTGS